MKQSSEASFGLCAAGPLRAGSQTGPSRETHRGRKPKLATPGAWRKATQHAGNVASV